MPDFNASGEHGAIVREGLRSVTSGFSQSRNLAHDIDSVIVISSSGA